MEKNTNTRHDNSIPTLREYLQTKAAEARLNAARHILQQETPNVPIIPSRSPWSIAAAVLGMSDADRIKYFGTSDVQTCIYTATNQYNDNGAKVSGNVTFRKNPESYGFTGIPMDSVKAGDLVQFTSDRPHHSTIMTGMNSEGEPTLSYSNGNTTSYDVLENGDTLFTMVKNNPLGVLTEALGKPAAFRYNGSAQKQAEWTDEYFKKYNVTPTSVFPNTAIIQKMEELRETSPVKYDEGGQIQRHKPWNELSLSEKSEMIKVAVMNGITDLPTIKEKYNEFAEGGDTKGLWTMEDEAKYREWRNSLPDNLRLTNDNDYDMRGAFKAGMQPTLESDGLYHLGSRDPETGRILKAPYHPTYLQAINTDARMGYYPMVDDKGQTYTQTWEGNLFADGGIHIAPSKKGTFTAAATKHGMGVQEFASKVLSHPENYSPAMRKKANFARNAAKWHGEGGNLFEDGGFWNTIDSYANGAEKALSIGSLAATGATIAAPNPYTLAAAYATNVGSGIIDGYQGIRASLKGDYGNALKNAGELLLSISGAKLLKDAQKLSKLDDALRTSGATREYITRTVGRRTATKHTYKVTKEAAKATDKNAIGFALSTGANASSMGDIPTKAFGGPLVEDAMAHYYDGISEDTQHIEVPDNTYVYRSPMFSSITPELSREAALNRTNNVFSNYNEAIDTPLSTTETNIKNAARWVKDNIYEAFPSGVSNCTLTTTQWVDPTKPVNKAASIVNAPSLYNYQTINQEQAVPGDILISRNPNNNTYHTMLVTGFADKPGVYDFDGTPYKFDAGEPLLTYSKGGHDVSFIRRDIPLSVYTPNSDGKIENHFFRYKYPKERFLPEIVITPNR